jgi:hypothetical protein
VAWVAEEHDASVSIAKVKGTAASSRAVIRAPYSETAALRKPFAREAGRVSAPRVPALACGFEHSG